MKSTIFSNCFFKFLVGPVFRVRSNEYTNYLSLQCVVSVFSLETSRSINCYSSSVPNLCSLKHVKPFNISVDNRYISKSLLWKSYISEVVIVGCSTVPY